MEYIAEFFFFFLAEAIYCSQSVVVHLSDQNEQNKTLGW